jgi:hypothetical protein
MQQLNRREKSLTPLHQFLLTLPTNNLHNQPPRFPKGINIGKIQIRLNSNRNKLPPFVIRPPPPILQRRQSLFPNPHQNLPLRHRIPLPPNSPHHPCLDRQYPVIKRIHPRRNRHLNPVSPVLDRVVEPPFAVADGGDAEGFCCAGGEACFEEFVGGKVPDKHCDGAAAEEEDGREDVPGDFAEGRGARGEGGELRVRSRMREAQAWMV